MEKYKIEIVNTHEQITYTGSIQDRLHVMTALAQKFKSNVRLWRSWPVDDGCGCIDYEVEIVHEVAYKLKK